MDDNGERENGDREGIAIAESDSAKQVMKKRHKVITRIKSPPEYATIGAKNKPFTTPLKALFAAIARPSDCSFNLNIFFRIKGNVSDIIEFATEDIILTLSRSHTIRTTPAIVLI